MAQPARSSAGPDRPRARSGAGPERTGPGTLRPERHLADRRLAAHERLFPHVRRRPPVRPARVRRLPSRERDRLPDHPGSERADAAREPAAGEDDRGAPAPRGVPARPGVSRGEQRPVTLPARRWEGLPRAGVPGRGRLLDPLRHPGHRRGRHRRGHDRRRDDRRPSALVAGRRHALLAGPERGERSDPARHSGAQIPRPGLASATPTRPRPASASAPPSPASAPAAGFGRLPPLPPPALPPPASAAAPFRRRESGSGSELGRWSPEYWTPPPQLDSSAPVRRYRALHADLTGPGRGAMQVGYIPLTSPTTLPSGSANCAMEGPSGMSIGGMTVLPPSFSALSSAA